MGQRQVRGLFPHRRAIEARDAVAATAEAVVRVSEHGRLPLHGIDDPRGALDSLRAAGGLAGAAEARALLALARGAQAVRPLGAERETFPRLAEIAAAIPDLGELSREGAKLFDADGSIADGASPRLKQIRVRLRKERQRLYDRSREWISRHSAETGGETVVVRDDRYCVPVAPSAVARVPGIVHGRSGSGQTIFVEPMEIVDSNNEIALLASDERHEEERIRREFGRHLLARSADFLAAADALAALDAIEARARLARETESAAPEFSDAGAWELAGARHPLLDSRLASVRAAVFGEEPRAEREAIPLDVELSPEKRWLLVSGPNAGGKTVVLKTLGLFSMMAQSGFLLPARRAVLPVFSSFHALVGDEQSILDDLSSFSSAMRRLAEILREFDGGGLALLDELGTGTDPEEGGAIAVACVETLVERGGRLVVTTHLSAIKDFGASRPDAQVAAMEFDEASGRPTFRLRPGFTGRSRALATAVEQGLPEAAIARARQLLGTSWAARERLEEEAEREIAKLRAREGELEGAVAAARQREARAARRSEELEAERAKLLAEGREAIEKTRRELRREGAAAIERIRQEKLDAAKARRSLGEIERRALAQPLVLEAEAAARRQAERLGPGDPVRLRGSTTSGRIESLEGDSAWLVAGGIRIRVARSELVAAAAGPPRRGTVTSAPVESASAEVNVIGKTVEDAIPEVERAIDRSLSAGQAALRVIHGHGTGRLREGLRRHFQQHPAVASLRAGDPREGGNGATIVTLR